MSTYKSLGGPPGGAIVTNDAEIAEKIDMPAWDLYEIINTLKSEKIIKVV